MNDDAQSKKMKTFYAVEIS